MVGRKRSRHISFRMFREVESSVVLRAQGDRLASVERDLTACLTRLGLVEDWQRDKRIELVAHNARLSALERAF